VIRACESGQSKPTEVVLTRSQVSGKPVRFRANREHVLRALALGFTNLHVVNADTVLLCQDDQRKFVWMPLPKEGAILASADAVRLVSGAVEQPTRAPTTPRSSPAMMTSPSPNGATRRKARQQPAPRKQASGMNAIQEALSLKQLLQDAYTRTSQLIMALKKNRKQSQMVRAALGSLRQLQRVAE
jgi:hypothetical protein